MPLRLTFLRRSRQSPNWINAYKQYLGSSQFVSQRLMGPATTVNML
jgi:hypothetical protein